MFASLESELGADLFVRLHGDWREYQAGSVRDTLAADGMRTWLACDAERVVGLPPRPCTSSDRSARS